MSICALALLVAPQSLHAGESLYTRETWRELEKMSVEYHKTTDEGESADLFEKMMLKFMDLKNAGSKVTEIDMFKLCRKPDVTNETEGSHLRVYYHPTKEKPKKVFLVVSRGGTVDSVTVNLFGANDFSGFKEYTP